MVVKYLHQRLPVPMVIPEHDDPQVMVLASFYYFRRDLSLLFSLRNTLIQFAELQRIFSIYKIAVNVFVKL